MVSLNHCFFSLLSNTSCTVD